MAGQVLAREDERRWKWARVDSSGVLRRRGLGEGSRLAVVAVEVSNSGFDVAEHFAADQITGQLDVGRDGLRLSLHRGVIKNQVHLGFHAREIAFDFFQRLLTALNVGEPSLQDVHRGRSRLAKSWRFAAILQLAFKGVDPFLQTFWGVFGTGCKQVVACDEELEINPFEIVESVAIGVDHKLLSLRVAINLEDFIAAALQPRQPGLIVARQQLYQRNAFGLRVVGGELLVPGIDDFLKALVERQERNDGSFRSESEKPEARVPKS